MPTVTIPRTVSEHAMYFDFPPGAEVPVRMRDDLDPCSPPMEYAGGRISWSGYPSREARDEGRAAAEGAARRAGSVRARQRVVGDIADLERARQTLQQSVARCAGHAPLHTSEARGYRYGVTDGRTGSAHNRAAHGNIEVTDTCRCGAKRLRLINGCHEETSSWTDAHYREIDGQLATLRAQLADLTLVADDRGLVAQAVRS